MHFNNKVVWITGASSGIGAALAKRFAKNGARLILTSRNIEALHLVKDDCVKEGADCVVLPADMLDSEGMALLTEKAIAVFSHIDIVVLNAGSSQRSYATETQMNVYRYLMELNFFAPVAITKNLLPHFAGRKTGHIVAVSSVAGLMGFPLRTGYAASKHALKGFFETLQTENKIEDLFITIVSPGRINTPISINAVKGDGEKHGLMDTGQLNGIPVEKCAQEIIDAIRLKKKHVLIAQSEKFLWWLWWFARPLYYNIARKKGAQH